LRLRQHLNRWRRITNNPDLLKLIAFGLKFEMSSPPDVRKRGPTFRGSADQKRHLAETLQKWLDEGIIEPDANPQSLICLLFPVPKPGHNNWRWVLDSRPLNKQLEQRKFRMEGVRHVRRLMKRNDYLTSIDLKQAYLHVQVNRRQRRFLAFRALGRQYRFAAMSFGTSVAPSVFTSLMKPVMAQLHVRGIRATIYLDDLLIVASSFGQSLEHTETARQLPRSSV
jgi:hypothetical protein